MKIKFFLPLLVTLCSNAATPQINPLVAYYEQTFIEVKNTLESILETTYNLQEQDFDEFLDILDDLNPYMATQLIDSVGETTAQRIFETFIKYKCCIVNNLETISKKELGQADIAFTTSILALYEEYLIPKLEELYTQTVEQEANNQNSSKLNANSEQILTTINNVKNNIAYFKTCLAAKKQHKTNKTKAVIQPPQDLQNLIESLNQGSLSEHIIIDPEVRTSIIAAVGGDESAQKIAASFIEYFKRELISPELTTDEQLGDSILTLMKDIVTWKNNYIKKAYADVLKEIAILSTQSYVDHEALEQLLTKRVCCFVLITLGDSLEKALIKRGTLPKKSR